MRLNGQYFKSYTEYSMSDLQSRIAYEWENIYSDCKIVSISTSISGRCHHALVVFEEGVE